jgi:AraC-like DNA-binding protein
MKVFLSSTAQDLDAYRRVADDTILRLSQQTVAMERFGPLPRTPVEECERLASESDVLVCIVAHRYGFVPEKGKGSITQREVEAAKNAGKDVLAWIVADDFPWTEKQEQDLLTDPAVLSDRTRVIEIVRGIEALAAFKKWLRDNFVCDTFTTPDDLAKKIAVTLSNYISEHKPPPLPQEAKSALPKDRISIARLPVSGPDLFGRDAELQLLDAAWENPNTNIVSFIAWGGVGKTALVNHWLKQRMARDNYRGAERVYAWSFYSQGTSERAASADLFIDQALRWFGDTDPTAGSPWDKGERLARYIRQTRTLLILDGLEPLQHPPGPQEGRLKDPALQAMLVELAGQQPGLCVISTYCDLLLGKLLVQEVKERVGRTLEWIKEDGILLAIALDNVSLSRAWLLEAQLAGTSDTMHAAEFLQRAVGGLRHAAQMDELPRGLLARAELHRFNRDYALAERDLAEVFRIATRSGMGLYLAEYHLESARLRLAQDNKEKAREHFATAKEMIERMGYHRRDKEVNELEQQLG